MNYLQIFAKGGKIDTKAIKSEIARIFMLEDSPEKVEQLWQDAVNTYGSEEGVLSEIFKQVGENPSDESVQQAIMNVLNYTPMEESQIFKCGGKLQQLVTKFGKGGGVDCGCNGIKLGQEGTYLEADTPVHAAAKAARRTVSVPWPGIARRRMGAVKDDTGGLHLYEIGDINGNTAQTSVSIPAPGDTIVNQSIATTHGWNHKVLPQESLDYEMVMQRIRPFIKNGVPYKQEGGIVYTDLPGHDVDTRLTRRQARELARVNGMSENNEQFAFAMANAMNAARAMGLRGAEARQRAREMAAGIKPTERSIVNTPTQLNVSAPVLNAPAAITASEQLTLPETQRTLDALLDETNSGLVRSLNRTGNRSQTEQTSSPQIEQAQSGKSKFAMIYGRPGWSLQPKESITNVVSTPTQSNETSNTQKQTSDTRNFGAGRNQWYLNVTGGQEALDDAGVKLFEYADPNSEAYQAGQRQARKEAGITTAAGIATAAALPAALNAATTYVPEAVQYVRLARDLRNTRNAAQAARGTGQLLMRNVGTRGLQTAEQVQAGWNGGLGAMRDGMLLHKQGGQIVKTLNK